MQIISRFNPFTFLRAPKISTIGKGFCRQLYQVLGYTHSNILTGDNCVHKSSQNSFVLYLSFPSQFHISLLFMMAKLSQAKLSKNIFCILVLDILACKFELLFRDRSKNSYPILVFREGTYI